MLLGVTSELAESTSASGSAALTVGLSLVGSASVDSLDDSSTDPSLVSVSGVLLDSGSSMVVSVDSLASVDSVVSSDPVVPSDSAGVSSDVDSVESLLPSGDVSGSAAGSVPVCASFSTIGSGSP